MVNGRIDKYQFEEGYCQAEKDSYYTSRDNFTFYYYDHDHLGNIRQVTKANKSKTGTVIQKNNYYPFGAEFCDNSSKNYVQKHKYNGKEFDNMHGLNSYDYGARQYNPVTARWDRIDPLAEKYYSTSPYVYCMNNPVKLVDPNGMFFTDGSWELLNRLLNNINNRIEKNQQKINNIQEKINSGKYSDKKISKFNKDIDKYNADIKEMNNVRSEISVLEASSQGYSLSEDPSLTRTDGTSIITDGTSVFNTQTNIFEMKIGNGYELGLIAHELKHGYQFETGAYSSGRRGSGEPFYDQQDEWEAYNRGALFSNSQRIFALDKEYQSLQVGPKDFTSLNQTLMSNLQDFARRTRSAFRINGTTYNGM